MMKSIEEVKKLIWNWKMDPIWDLENTEGFEEYREELLAVRQSAEAQWERERKTMRENQYEAQYDRRIAEALERIAAALESMTNKGDGFLSVGVLK